MNKYSAIVSLGMVMLLIGCSGPIPCSEGIDTCQSIHKERVNAEIEKLKKGLKPVQF